MCMETPIAIMTRINFSARVSTTNATEDPIVIHSMVMVMTFTLKGIPFLSR